MVEGDGRQHVSDQREVGGRREAHPQEAAHLGEHRVDPAQVAQHARGEALDIVGDRIVAAVERRPHLRRPDELQRRTGAVYAELAAAQWGGRWAVVPPEVDAAELARQLKNP